LEERSESGLIFALQEVEAEELVWQLEIQRLNG
jgi:hypothetical protein